ncbi:MAG TPA: ATP-binding protein, partial [Anaerolineae bacterium]|nr:ATP-binding protein [Anaerolineae bacterium]
LRELVYPIYGWLVAVPVEPDFFFGLFIGVVGFVLVAFIVFRVNTWGKKVTTPFRPQSVSQKTDKTLAQVVGSSCSTFLLVLLVFVCIISLLIEILRPGVLLEVLQALELAEGTPTVTGFVPATVPSPVLAIVANARLAIRIVILCLLLYWAAQAVWAVCLTLWPCAYDATSRFWPLVRATLPPLPRVERILQQWLVQDWDTGLHNVGELLKYTRQSIPVTGAVSGALARLRKDDALHAVTTLLDLPVGWRVLQSASVSPFRAMWLVATGIETRLPERWRARLLAPASDVPARAACAAYLHLHKGDLRKATEAFAEARSLPGGQELYLTTASLAAALEAEDSTAVGQWLEASAGLAELSEPLLRPTVLRTLHRLRDIAREADLARHAASPLMRSSALNRAVAALTQLLSDVEDICPQPEAAIVKTVAERWRDALATAGGQIGAQVLRQPVENPYEGYSGLPVERTFVGRRDVLARLERLWAASPDAPLPPIILYGHRRMGKTSIIHHLYRHRGPETLIARADMQDLALADHTGQLLLGFARAIHAAARAARLDAGPLPDEDNYETAGMARMALNTLLERLEPQMSGRRLTLAVDEYDIADAKIEEGKFAPDFLRYLRSAAQRYRWFGLLFAGCPTLEDELRHYRAVFFGSAEPVQVSFLNREAALHLIRRPSDDFALEIEAVLAEELYRLTNGQPYLLQRLCWEMVN